jgi:hypothetical protein
MLRTVFAMAVVALCLAAVPGTSQASPIAPLPAGITATDHGSVTHVRWWRHHRHCWRGRWGRLHCAW